METEREDREDGLPHAPETPPSSYHGPWCGDAKKGHARIDDYILEILLPSIIC